MVRLLNTIFYTRCLVILSQIFPGINLSSWTSAEVDPGMDFGVQDVCESKDVGQGQPIFANLALNPKESSTHLNWAKIEPILHNLDSIAGHRLALGRTSGPWIASSSMGRNQGAAFVSTTGPYCVWFICKTNPQPIPRAWVSLEWMSLPRSKPRYKQCTGRLFSELESCVSNCFPLFL